MPSTDYERRAEMGWAAFSLTYRAITPLHLGCHPLGFIRRTRYYVPGWTLWGAITAQLTRFCYPKASGSTYEEVGQFVADNLPTSYAYILVNGKLASPRFRKGRLFYGDLLMAEFEAQFVASLGQTAIAPESLTAFTRSLHETEVLTAYNLVSGEPVRWQFVIYMRRPWKAKVQRLKGLTPDDVLQALERLVLGGDRRYGLGLLRREGEPKPLKKVEGGEWPTPFACNSADRRILQAHVPVADLSGYKVRGRIEPIPWRWWENSPGRDAWGPGQFRKVQVFYVPGSKVEEAGWTPVVGPRGIWRARLENAIPMAS